MYTDNVFDMYEKTKPTEVKVVEKKEDKLFEIPKENENRAFELPENFENNLIEKISAKILEQLNKAPENIEEVNEDGIPGDNQ